MDIGTYCILTKSSLKVHDEVHCFKQVWHGFSPLLKEEIFLIGIFIAILIVAEPKPVWLISKAILKHPNSHLGSQGHARVQGFFGPSAFCPAAAAINAMGSYLSYCQLNHCYLKAFSDLNCMYCSILLKTCMQFFCTV